MNDRTSGVRAPAAGNVAQLAEQAARRGEFRSILYDGTEGRARRAPTPEIPEYFRDLNLDQVIDAVTAGKDEFKPFFYDRLKSIDAVQYRHEVMRDLENRDALACIKSFAAGMRLMRDQTARAKKLYYHYQKQRWLLHAAETYCAAISKFRDDLSPLLLSSRGLLAFRDYVAAYTDSADFASLVGEIRELTGALASIQYSIIIKANGFKVRHYDSEQDYSAKVADTFRKFQQGAVKDYRVQFRSSVEMDHIEAKVLEFVAKLNPDTFSRLDASASSGHAMRTAC